MTVPSKNMRILLPVLIACGDTPVTPVDGSALSGAREDAATLQIDTLTTENDPGPPLDESDVANLEGVLYGPYFDASGNRSVAVRREARQQWTQLVVSERQGTHWKADVLVAGSANPDRPAISEDGETIAFVAGLTGIASVWTLPFDGSEDPVQHTNVGLHLVKRAPGQPPPGFVPPPATGTLAFDGDHLVWEGPAGPQQVRWR